jgi:hypothetical protein
MRRFDRKTKEGYLTRDQALECTPVKSDRVAASRLEPGDVLLSYPEAVRPWSAAIFGRGKRKPEKHVIKKLQLDALGTEVWDLLDEGIRVRDVIRRFADSHRLRQREAEVAVTRFLRELGKRGLIGLR